MNQMKSLLLVLVAIMSADAFAPAAMSRQRLTPMSMAVVDIDGEAAFDNTIKSAGESLVVVDYSTTWCGPCKVIAPKFDEFSEKYPDAVFLKVRSCVRFQMEPSPSSQTLTEFRYLGDWRR
jgi:thiol-disulfide isomerase/thioredoxin